MILNLIILIFEILYYSLFMKYARKEGSFYSYLFLFIIINILLMLTGSLNIYAYLIFMITSTFGLKIIGKTSLFDMFMIFLMLLFKLFIELLFAFELNFFIPNIDICKIILGLIKVGVIIYINNRLNIIYNKLKEKWNKNNFYIRYIFSTLMFIYIISACLFLINFG